MKTLTVYYPNDTLKKAHVKFEIMKMRRMLDLKDEIMWWKNDEVKFVSELGFKSNAITREKLMHLIRRIKNEERS